MNLGIGERTGGRREEEERLITDSVEKKKLTHTFLDILVLSCPLCLLLFFFPFFFF